MSGMKSLDPHNRPREKLLKKGVNALNSQELLQVVIGSGVKGADVVTISKKLCILLETGNGKVKLEDLLKVKGISTASSAKILASLEVANRFNKTGTCVESIEDIVGLLSDFRDKKQEHFVVLTLDGANRLIERRVVSVGTLIASLMHPREVFADAIGDRAASIIVAHNHPSGSLTPSVADLEVTKRLAATGELLGIELLDHIIISRNGYISII
jgi:DNA repair protein RadC